ncbi:MAG: DNA repair protein RecN [Gammaproteobacteria bacterium]
MLRELHIRDLAVIESVAIEIGPGFTTLTGETGAGKSILIDALALALGERSDALAIRSGAERLEVSATFDTSDNQAANAWLLENELGEESSDCVLRRVVGSDGRSRAWINGRPVPVQTLRELGGRLVDICGQQDYQSLRHKNTQRDVLDNMGDTGSLRDEVREAWRSWKAAEQEYRELLTRERDRDSRRELLAFQLSELQALNPREGEYAAAELEHRALQHRTQIANALHTALGRAYDDDSGSAQAAVAAARQALIDVLSFDPGLAAALQMLSEADIQIREAADLIRQRIDTLDQDPARESELDDRLAALQEAARKHRITPDELPVLQARLSEELAQLSNYAESCARLEHIAAGKRSAVEILSAQLSTRRGKAGTQLAKAIMQNMATLGMAGGQFEVRLKPLPDAAIGPDGADDIEFLVSANPGQPPAPMSRVASGGELSRLNLAIQVVATAEHGAPTLIFDEVDAGVGGAVAEIVGRKLRELSRQRQVLCVTHLPQVAAQASQHFTVRKDVARGKTSTSVQKLDAPARVEEIARMLGGLNITAQTRAHAQEMLDSAAESADSKPRKAAGRRRAPA